MAEYTWDTYLLSDLHKDARGFRPSSDYFEAWELANADERQRIWNGLIREMDERTFQEREEQQLAIANFEKSIQNIMMAGARDRKTAIRWIVDGLDVDGDASFACYKLGLPYTMATELRGI
jgi:hypothetical protein